jgi:hypothetical protein
MTYYAALLMGSRGLIFWAQKVRAKRP